MNGIPIWILPFALIVAILAAGYFIALMSYILLGILSPFIVLFCWITIKLGDAIDRRWGRWV